MSATSVSVKVYRKLKPHNALYSLVAEFNQFLQQHGVLDKYPIHPFLTTHPMHVTFYAIAVGLADEHGQIVEALGIFLL